MLDPVSHISLQFLPLQVLPKLKALNPIHPKALSPKPYKAYLPSTPPTYRPNLIRPKP